MKDFYTVLLGEFRNGIWMLGIPSCLFGITDRGFAALSDGYVSPIELLHFLTASCLLMSWIYLKPEGNVARSSIEKLDFYASKMIPYQYAVHLVAAQTRMVELQQHHMISQQYVLPFPYLSQIYHLLNLKHLETIHNFSLGNLKVIDVSSFQATSMGGFIKFRTTLDSSMNTLKIWRERIVEVELILHTPFTVELNIPIYQDKRMIVIFNVFPIGDNKHELLIDIYTDLDWPKPMLQPLLHFASYLTLYEDLPYLAQLSKRGPHYLSSKSKVSTHKTMWLFKRFVELYSSKLHQPQDSELDSEQNDFNPLLHSA